jgi:hypothetical protein
MKSLSEKTTFYFLFFHHTATNPVKPRLNRSTVLGSGTLAR